MTGLPKILFDRMCDQSLKESDHNDCSKKLATLVVSELMKIQCYVGEPDLYAVRTKMMGLKANIEKIYNSITYFYPSWDEDKSRWMDVMFMYNATFIYLTKHYYQVPESLYESLGWVRIDYPHSGGKANDME